MDCRKIFISQNSGFRGWKGNWRVCKTAVEQDLVWKDPGHRGQEGKRVQRSKTLGQDAKIRQEKVDDEAETGQYVRKSGEKREPKEVTGWWGESPAWSLPDLAERVPHEANPEGETGQGIGGEEGGRGSQEQQGAAAFSGRNGQAEHQQCWLTSSPNQEGWIWTQKDSEFQAQKEEQTKWIKIIYMLYYRDYWFDDHLSVHRLHSTTHSGGVYA